MAFSIGGGINIGGGISFVDGSAAADPYWANVTVLLSSTATTPPTNNDTFIDSSANNFTITRGGSTTQGSFSPFTPGQPYNASVNGGSAYFDGSGDFLSFTGTPATTLDGNFTFEAWIYVSSVSVLQPMMCIGDSFSNPGILFYIANDAKVSIAYSGSRTFTGSTSVSVNTWNHIAFVRSGTTVTVYLNGASQGTLTTSNTFSGTTTVVGREIYNGSVGGQLTGYLSNVRLVKGTAVYTSNFTPPTAPLTAISGTSLLLSMTNAAIYDSAQDSVFATVGNTALTTAVKNFGSSSIAFDGTDDYMVAPSATTLDFGTGDFTIETWVNFDALTTNRIIFDRWATGNTGGWQLYWRQTGTSLTFYVGSAIVIQDASTTRITTGTWYHVAVTRESGTVRMFVNGTQVGSASNTASLSSSLPLALGIQYTTLTNDLDGYLSDVRFTKGVARYTANFTPPDTVFPIY